jgi:hypothetical protein
MSLSHHAAVRRRLITHALAAAWVHLRDTETDWFHSKNQYAGLLITQCIRKLLMGNCIPGALFATFRHRRMALVCGEREMQKQLSLAY